jgi:hypothetical protein
MSKKGETYIRSFGSGSTPTHQVVTVLSEPFIGDHPETCKNNDTREKVKVMAFMTSASDYSKISIRYLDEFCDFEEGEQYTDDYIYHILNANKDIQRLFVRKIFTRGILYN